MEEINRIAIDKLYQETQEYGRSEFVKEIVRLQQQNAKLQSQIDELENWLLEQIEDARTEIKEKKDEDDDRWWYKEIYCYESALSKLEEVGK
jgi:hypothetical protein